MQRWAIIGFDRCVCLLNGDAQVGGFDLPFGPAVAPQRRDLLSSSPPPARWHWTSTACASSCLSSSPRSWATSCGGWGSVAAAAAAVPGAGAGWFGGSRHAPPRAAPLAGCNPAPWPPCPCLCRYTTIGGVDIVQGHACSDIARKLQVLCGAPQGGAWAGVQRSLRASRLQRLAPRRGLHAQAGGRAAVPPPRHPAAPPQTSNPFSLPATRCCATGGLWCCRQT